MSLHSVQEPREWLNWNYGCAGRKLSQYLNTAKHGFYSLAIFHFLQENFSFYSPCKLFKGTGDSNPKLWGWSIYHRLSSIRMRLYVIESKIINARFEGQPRRSGSGNWARALTLTFLQARTDTWFISLRPFFEAPIGEKKYFWPPNDFDFVYFLYLSLPWNAQQGTDKLPRISLQWNNAQKSYR